MRPKKHRIEEIPFASLRPHPRAQRALIPARLRELKNKWKMEELGVVTVCFKDGVYWIVNGQHRWKTAMDLGYGSAKVVCEIFTDLTDEEIAEKFLALNNARPVAMFDKYLVGLVAKDPVCLKVQQTLKKYGLRESRGGQSLGTFSAINVALKATAKNEPAWDNAIEATTAAWGTIPAAVDGVILEGIFKVFDKHNGSIDKKSLVGKLAKYPGGPGALRGNAKTHAPLLGTSVVGAVGDIVIRQYNKGRSESKSLAPL